MKKPKDRIDHWFWHLAAFLLGKAERFSMSMAHITEADVRFMRKKFSTNLPDGQYEIRDGFWRMTDTRESWENFCKVQQKIWNAEKKEKEQVLS